MTENTAKPEADTAATKAPEAPRPPEAQPALPKEVGGAKGPEPTRYGDWQHKGRVTDF